jgi:transposase InsO family protein
VAGLIAAQRVEHRIPCATDCRAPGVNPARVYKWVDGDASPRRARRQQLTIAIRQLFAARHGKYSSPRITDDLREAGWRVSQKTVAKIMPEQRLVGRPKERRKHTTRPGKGRWRAPDLVERDFPAATVNQKWYGDVIFRNRADLKINAPDSAVACAAGVPSLLARASRSRATYHAIASLALPPRSHTQRFDGPLTLSEGGPVFRSPG